SPSSRWKALSRSLPRPPPTNSNAVFENQKPGHMAGLFLVPDLRKLLRDAQLRNRRADLRERRGDLARLGQHEEVARSAGAIGKNRRLPGAIGVDLHGVDGDLGRLDIIAQGL